MNEQKRPFRRVLCLAPSQSAFDSWFHMAKKNAGDKIERVKADRLRFGNTLCQFTYVDQPQDLLGCDIPKNIVLIIPGMQLHPKAGMFGEVVRGMIKAQVLRAEGFRFPAFEAEKSTISPDDPRLRVPEKKVVEPEHPSLPTPEVSGPALPPEPALPEPEEEKAEDFEVSSGNVFKDLGFPDADQRLEDALNARMSDPEE